jgi:hypothetical protein
MSINIDTYNKTSIAYVILSGDIETFEKRTEKFRINLLGCKTKHFYENILNGGCYSGLFMILVRIVSGCTGDINIPLEGHNLIFERIVSGCNGNVISVSCTQGHNLIFDHLMSYINSKPTTESFSDYRISMIKNAALIAAFADNVTVVNKILDAMNATDKIFDSWFELSTVDSLARGGCINVVKMIISRHSKLINDDYFFVLESFADGEKWAEYTDFMTYLYNKGIVTLEFASRRMGEKVWFGSHLNKA